MHLAQFVKASMSDETQPPDKEVLWIHVPDLTAGGHIRDIQNITNFKTDHPTFFNALNHIKKTYPDEEKWLEFQENVFNDSPDINKDTVFSFRILFAETEMFKTLKFIQDTSILDRFTIFEDRTKGSRWKKTIEKIKWEHIQFLNMLKRNWFPSELVWEQNDACAGFKVGDKENCPYRPQEMQLFEFTPQVCLDNTVPGC